MIELVSTNHVSMLITVVLQLINSASNSVCLNKLHVATCAALTLVVSTELHFLGIHLAT